MIVLSPACFRPSVSLVQSFWLSVSCDLSIPWGCYLQNERLFKYAQCTKSDWDSNFTNSWGFIVRIGWSPFPYGGIAEAEPCLHNRHWPRTPVLAQHWSLCWVWSQQTVRLGTHQWGKVSHSSLLSSYRCISLWFSFWNTSLSFIQKKTFPAMCAFTRGWSHAQWKVCLSKYELLVMHTACHWSVFHTAKAKRCGAPSWISAA